MKDMPHSKIEGVPAFWDRVKKARRKVLVLDYDGTLAPFRIERMKAKPLPDSIAFLTRISESTNTHVAIISGRPVSELEKLLGHLNIEMVGSHGFEFRLADGQIRTMSPDRLQHNGLDEAFARVQETNLRSKIERKIASIAFHTRGSLDEEDRREFAKCLWEPIAEQYGLELRDFNGGVELRATGFNKGTAITELLRTEPDDALVVYIGDDETDEDAFIAIRERGIGIKVGGYGLRTTAAGRLPNCEAVMDFLRSWYEVTQRQRR